MPFIPWFIEFETAFITVILLRDKYFDWFMKGSMPLICESPKPNFISLKTIFNWASIPCNYTLKGMGDVDLRCRHQSYIENTVTSAVQEPLKLLAKSQMRRFPLVSKKIPAPWVWSSHGRTRFLPAQALKTDILMMYIIEIYPKRSFFHGAEFKSMANSSALSGKDVRLWALDFLFVNITMQPLGISRHWLNFLHLKRESNT